MLKIVFSRPVGRAQGERRSKLLQPGSSLYEWIISVRAMLTAMGKTFQTRDPHIELLRDCEKDDLVALNERAQTINNTEVPITITSLGRAVVIPTGAVPGYGYTHATIAFMPQGVSQAELQDIQKVVLRQTSLIPLSDVLSLGS